MCVCVRELVHTPAPCTHLSAGKHGFIFLGLQTPAWCQTLCLLCIQQANRGDTFCRHHNLIWKTGEDWDNSLQTHTEGQRRGLLSALNGCLLLFHLLLFPDRLPPVGQDRNLTGVCGWVSRRQNVVRLHRSNIKCSFYCWDAHCILDPLKRLNKPVPAAWWHLKLH